jgi:hypothetical protein
MTRSSIPIFYPLFRSSILSLSCGWGGRIRTYEWRLQRPLPYHLATPQQNFTCCEKAIRAEIKTPARVCGRQARCANCCRRHGAGSGSDLAPRMARHREAPGRYRSLRGAAIDPAIEDILSGPACAPACCAIRSRSIRPLRAHAPRRCQRSQRSSSRCPTSERRARQPASTVA